MKKSRILIACEKDWGLDEEKVSNLAMKVLKNEGFSVVELGMCFVDQKSAKKLNVKYRKMTYIPQVLAFPMENVRDADGWLRVGDVVICMDRLKKDAKEEGKGLYDLLEKWLEHGIGNLKKRI